MTKPAWSQLVQSFKRCLAKFWIWEMIFIEAVKLFVEVPSLPYDSFSEENQFWEEGGSGKIFSQNTEQSDS